MASDCALRTREPREGSDDQESTGHAQAGYRVCVWLGELEHQARHAAFKRIEY